MFISVLWGRFWVVTEMSETKYMCDLCDHVANHDDMADHFYEHHYTVGLDWPLNCTILDEPKLVQCGNCGRSFKQSIIDLHVYWCIKLNLPARYAAAGI